jgi:hypothetical protein
MQWVYRMTLFSFRVAGPEVRGIEGRSKEADQGRSSDSTHMGILRETDQGRSSDSIHRGILREADIALTSSQVTFL